MPCATATRPGQSPRHRAMRPGRHGLGVERGGGDHAVEGEQRESDRVDGVEQRLLVLLHVLVVGERQSLERREETREVADESTCLAPGEFGNIGVLLLGIIDDPVENPSSRVTNPNSVDAHRIHLADTAQVHPEQRHGEERLGHKVSIGDTVKAVVEDRIEAEVGGDFSGRAATTNRPALQRRAPRHCALAGIDEPLGIAARAQPWASRWCERATGCACWRVGVTGQVGVARLLGVGQERALQTLDQSSTSSIAERVQSRRSVAT